MGLISRGNLFYYRGVTNKGYLINYYPYSVDSDDKSKIEDDTIHYRNMYLRKLFRYKNGLYGKTPLVEDAYDLYKITPDYFQLYDSDGNIIEGFRYARTNEVNVAAMEAIRDRQIKKRIADIN